MKLVSTPPSLSKASLPFEDVAVPEWGKDVGVRVSKQTIAGSRIHAKCIVDIDKRNVDDEEKLTLKIAAHAMSCIIDPENGQCVFKPENLDQFYESLSAESFNKVTGTAMQVNPVDPAVVKKTLDAKKKKS